MIQFFSIFQMYRCIENAVLFYSDNWYFLFCRSHFHEVFIPKLLSTALKEYTASQIPGGGGGDPSVMTPTMVQVLTYLSLQHSQEIKSNLLALFYVGEAHAS